MMRKLERPARRGKFQKSFIMPSSEPVQGLQAVLAGSVRRTAKLYAEQGQALRMATVDQDATIIESHKENALAHYEGGRGYQPMVAVWAEADLVLADEFRDGNVPAQQEPLTCAQLAFAALPDTIQERYFRGDSACHENDLLGWLKHPDREKEPGGRIGFAVSARMSAGAGQGDSPGPGSGLEDLRHGSRRHLAAMGRGGLCAGRSRGKERQQALTVCGAASAQAPRGAL